MKWQIKYAVIIALFVIAGGVGNAHAHPKGDGKLSLYSYHSDEFLDVSFRNDRGYDNEGLKKINNLMRSRGDDQIHEISPELIDLIDHLQDHFHAETVEIISGYRSSAFNEFLRDNGRGAASESLHTKGMAADIHIDEVSEKALWDYAKTLGVGGAGYYPRYNFVHVDVGEMRTWSEPPPSERILVGCENSPHKGWSAITDKNIYALNEPITVAVKNEMMDKQPLVKNFWYERFRKGAWSERGVISKSKGVARLGTGESFTYTWTAGAPAAGKYRIVVFTSRDYSVPPAYSNEFYVKTQ